MWRWRTDDIPHPLTGWKPENQTHASGRLPKKCTSKSGDGNPSAFTSGNGFIPDTPSASASLEFVIPQVGKGEGDREGKGPNILRAVKKPTRRPGREPAPDEPKPSTCPHPYKEKGTEFQEPDTPGLEEKASGLKMPPAHRTAEPAGENAFCLEICDVKIGGLGCPYCNPNFTNVFAWADYISKVDKWVPPPVRVDLKTCETEEWVTYVIN